MYQDQKSDYLIHYGTKGQKWGVRKYQNLDGSLTAIGRSHYGYSNGRQASITNPYNLRSAGGTTKSNFNNTGHTNKTDTYALNGTEFNAFPNQSLGTVGEPYATNDSRKLKIEKEGTHRPLDLGDVRIQTYEYNGGMYISDEDGQYTMYVGPASMFSYNSLKNIKSQLTTVANNRQTMINTLSRDLASGKIQKEQYDVLRDNLDITYLKTLSNVMASNLSKTKDTSISYILSSTIGGIEEQADDLYDKAESIINSLKDKTVSAISNAGTEALSWLEKMGIVTTKIKDSNFSK